MKIRLFALCTVLLATSACEGTLGGKDDKSVDRGFDRKDLSQLKAGIWVDPTGCDHWIVDDGLEGYLSQRLDRNGKPVCSGQALAGYAVGDFKSGSRVEDPY